MVRRLPQGKTECNFESWFGSNGGEIVEGEYYRNRKRLLFTKGEAIVSAWLRGEVFSMDEKDDSVANYEDFWLFSEYCGGGKAGRYSLL
jgi:hypothetical protein